MTAHIISYSGGKDSTALYLLAQELAARHGFTFQAVFCDTGNEHPMTLDYVAGLPDRADGPPIRWIRADFTSRFAHRRQFVSEQWLLHGVPAALVERALAVLHPTGVPFLDLCLLKGRFPSRRAQFCTEALKTLPFVEQVVMPLLDAGERVLSWQGVRAAESTVRASLPRFENRRGGYWIWRPLHRWSVEEVFAIHRRHGIAPNPLYRQGMRRVGCMPCVNCAKDELREIARRFPEHIERIAEWEALVSAASKRGASTFFHKQGDVPDGASAQDIFAMANVREAVRWAMTSRGGRQFDLLRMQGDVPACASAYGLCE
jgi:3'-phosphoadenosine 5'-phosphosulfate sulfotransferase (PAPS reductase)/FAD synthetase